MFTKKEYYNNAYTTEIDTTVVSCKKCDNTQYDVVLEATCFFPEAGGQSSDKGTIRPVNSKAQDSVAEVFDVQIDSDEIIHHFCNRPLVEGEKVHLSIDWIRRHTFMQHHTAEHIFSGLVHKQFGYDNVGFHLSDNICTMDYNGKLSNKDIQELEKQANECIYKNCAVTTLFPTDDELADMDYRCKGELTPPIRIVNIDNGNIDCCACCAPHVNFTGEIGLIKVVSSASYKGGVRLTIICGRSAFSLFSDYFNTVLDASHILSVPDREITERIKEVKDECYNLKQEIISLHNEKLDREVSNIPPDQKNVLIFEKDLETKTIRNCVNRLVESHSGLCGVFCGSDSEGYSFILASQNADMKKTTAILRDTLGAKCGGSDVMIQGFVNSSSEEITRTLEDINF